MNDKEKHVRKIWRSSRFFCLYLFPAMIVVITVSNLLAGPTSVNETPLQQIGIAVGFLAFDAVMYGFSVLIFKFVLGLVRHPEPRK